MKEQLSRNSACIFRSTEDGGLEIAYNNEYGKVEELEFKRVLKAFESFSGWYWFATEKIENNWNGAPLWFGFVQGFEEEWGNFSEAELRSLGNQCWEIPFKNLSYSGARK